MSVHYSHLLEEPLYWGCPFRHPRPQRRVPLYWGCPFRQRHNAGLCRLPVLLEDRLWGGLLQHLRHQLCTQHRVEDGNRRCLGLRTAVLYCAQLELGSSRSCLHKASPQLFYLLVPQRQGYAREVCLRAVKPSKFTMEPSLKLDSMAWLLQW